MHFAPWDPAIRAEPHRFWSQVRTAQPVASVQGPVTGNTIWFWTRYDGCVSAVPASSLGKEPEQHLPPAPIAINGEQGPFDVPGHNMVFVDPPDNSGLRSRVRNGYSEILVERAA